MSAVWAPAPPALAPCPSVVADPARRDETDEVWGAIAGAERLLAGRTEIDRRALFSLAFHVALLLERCKSLQPRECRSLGSISELYTIPTFRMFGVVVLMT